MKFTVQGQDQIFSIDSDEETITIGRASENDFVIPLNALSRKHCMVTVKGNYFFITDLGSKNGVTIDGNRIEPNVTKPVYSTNKIVLANHFRLYLPNQPIQTYRTPETATQSEVEFEMELEEIGERKK